MQASTIMLHSKGRLLGRGAIAVLAGVHATAIWMFGTARDSSAKGQTKAIGVGSKQEDVSSQQMELAPTSTVRVEVSPSS